MYEVFTLELQLTSWGQDKMAVICKQHFQIHFLYWNLMDFYSNFIEICSQGPNKQWDSIGSDNGLALNRWQAIIWTNDGLIWWPIYALFGLDELKKM